MKATELPRAATLAEALALQRASVLPCAKRASASLVLIIVRWWRVNSQVYCLAEITLS